MNIYEAEIHDGTRTVIRATQAASLHTAVSRMLGYAIQDNEIRTDGVVDIRVRLLEKGMTMTAWRQTESYKKWKESPQ